MVRFSIPLVLLTLFPWLYCSSLVKFIGWLVSPFNIVWLTSSLQNCEGLSPVVSLLTVMQLKPVQCADPCYFLVVYCPICEFAVPFALPSCGYFRLEVAYYRRRCLTTRFRSKVFSIPHCWIFSRVPCLNGMFSCSLLYWASAVCFIGGVPSLCTGTLVSPSSLGDS